MMRDDLMLWRTVRARLDWSGAVAPVVGPVAGANDGVTDFIATDAAGRDPRRADRLLDALRCVQLAAAAGQDLSFAALTSWWAMAMDRQPVGFRSTASFGQDGRECYGLTSDTAEAFDDCLAEAIDPLVPLAARVARVYLDVAFFRPYPDGNARAAKLATAFVLYRDQVVPDMVAPMFLARPRANDPQGALDLTRLVNALIVGTQRRTPSVQVRPPVGIGNSGPAGTWAGEVRRAASVNMLIG